MTASIDKSVYLKFWQQINPSNDAQIRTQKIIQWVQCLVSYEEEAIKQPEIKKQAKNKKQKVELKDQNKKSDKKVNQKNKNNQKDDKNNTNEPKAHKEPTEKSESNPLHKNEITEEVILSYIKKYSETEQYKLLSKQIKNPSEPLVVKEEKQKKTVSKSPTKKFNKKSEPKVQEAKFDESLICLIYEEAIFFYYWLKKMYEKDEKERFIQRVRKEQENAENQKRKLEQNQEAKVQEVQSAESRYQPKHFMELTEREMSYLNEESFLSLKQHEPKISILFKHYAKLSHFLTKQVYTFEERQVLQKMMTLHQWMMFCKEWNILTAKNINEGWEVGKVTREFLMDVYYKNSFYRKEMSFEMFERALIAVACRMYQDCDIYKAKPIDMMLIFLSIKNEQSFIQNLEIKNISYRQGEILSCFKVKNRDAFEKMNIIKVTGNQAFKKSKFTLLDSKTIKRNQTLKDVNTFQNGPERYSQSQYTQRGTEPYLMRTPTQQINVKNEKQSLDQNYSTGSLSKVSFNRKNRKSAPEIGIKLPSIDSNRFFQKIPQNNHLNKFKEYIENEVPESSSVLRNKITGYHKIHTIHAQEEEQKMSIKNKNEHMKISKLIVNKLEDILDSEKYTPSKLNQTLIKKDSLQVRLNGSNNAFIEDKIKRRNLVNSSVLDSINTPINPEKP